MLSRSWQIPKVPLRSAARQAAYGRRHIFQKTTTTTTTRAAGPNASSKWQQFVSVASIAAAGAMVAGGFAYANLGEKVRLDASESPVDRPILDTSHWPDIKYASTEQMKQAIEEIRRELNDDNVDIISTDPVDLLAHGYAEWSSVNVDVLPVAVAYPRNTEQVQAIARICTKHRVPIVPYSGGSSLEGNTGAPFGGVSLDFSYMDKILRFSPEDMDATVQPGLGWVDLNEELANRGAKLFFPVDPSPSAKFGGMVGTNCSGTNAVRYGTMRDWVLNLTVVLADGSIVKTRRRPRKCSAGYNLNGIIVGSEGTLGIVTEITIKLAPVPEHFSVAVVPFPSLKSAVSAATAVIRGGVPVTALELMDDVQMKVVNDVGSTLPKVWKEAPTLFFKFSGTKGIVQDNIETVKKIVAEFEPGDFEWATDPEDQATLWSARKESLFSFMSLRKEGEQIWVTDVAVPLSRLADLVDASKKEAQASGLKATVKGHVGDSNFHENICYNATDPNEVAKAEKLVKNMVRRAIEMEGTCTGEHAIGFGKKDGLRQEVGEDTVTVMKLFKNTLDPHWILNPGKIFDRQRND
ncbi:D-lactate dehydrogenase (cytochrome) [Geosmithia morbida]|uniref:D-lactate dehydrogenase (cytochrome) n=1 Tax=Geosmithia morbida TaxID=1094350 RepID=A0A9P5CZL0_9HYPO|nr:D-lactate dehydrogenase (cytochrome) [Geosmithia morbida]KAF4121698.1 D-lactate dehydrogenase (cytochrome) [Geosmithia morbida]